MVFDVEWITHGRSALTNDHHVSGSEQVPLHVAQET